MPFRSEKQRRYLWKHEPKIAREWTDEYGSKPQPTKKAKSGTFIKRRMQLAGSEEFEKIIKELRKNKFVKRRLKLSGGKVHGGISLKNKDEDRLTQWDIKQLEEATKKNLTPAQAREIIKRYRTGEKIMFPDKIKKGPSYLKGKEKAKEHKEKLKKLGKKTLGYVEGWLGKKQGGGVKKRKPWKGYDPTTDKPRPRPNPFGEKKKPHFKAGGTMEPYRGSYISGTVDGTKLSNPSLRKYYKGVL